MPSAITDVEFDHKKLAEILTGSIAEHARKLGITRAHLTNIVNGRRRPSANLLLKLQQVYKIDTAQLIKRN